MYFDSWTNALFLNGTSTGTLNLHCVNKICINLLAHNTKYRILRVHWERTSAEYAWTFAGLWSPLIIDRNSQIIATPESTLWRNQDIDWFSERVECIIRLARCAKRGPPIRRIFAFSRINLVLRNYQSIWVIAWNNWNIRQNGFACLAGEAQRT